MDIFDSKYYRFIKFLLSTIGCWSYHSGLKKRIPQFCIVFTLSISLIPQFFNVYAIRFDIDELLACCPAVLVTLIPALQLSVYYFYDDKVRKILDNIKNDWDVRLQELDLEILRYYTNTAKFYILLYFVNVGSGVCTVILMSLTNPVLDILFPLNETRSRQAVFDVVLPFDQEKHFDWVFYYGTLTGTYNLSVVLTCESFYAISTMHACGLFSIVSRHLKNVTELLNGKTRNEDENLANSIHQELFHSIEHHIYALNFAKTLDSLYSPLLFTTVLFNVVILSTSGFGILTTLDKVDKCIKYAAYTVAVFLHFYCITLPAQRLMDRSSNVAHSAYDVCWYQIPLKSRKLLLLLIRRSQESCKMTAGKFYKVDMETFSALVQTSVSFFTMLFSLR